jgi:hypothetical protein
LVMSNFNESDYLTFILRPVIFGPTCLLQLCTQLLPGDDSLVLLKFKKMALDISVV